MIQKKKAQSHDPYAPVAKNPLLAARLPAWRSKFIVLLMFGAFASLAARAFWVQVVNQDFYVDQGQKRYQRTIELDASRGRIVDRNGSMLAVSLATYEIWASPKLIDEAAFPPLSKLLDLPLAELRRRLNGDKTFVLLKRQVDADTAAHVCPGWASPALRRSRIRSSTSRRRVRPCAHRWASPDLEDNGQEGVELAANEQLLGVPGHREVIRDRLGRVVSETRPLVPARNGETIHLTIDRRIQQLAYAQLKEAIAKHHADAGSVVVLDARNGEILALANYPSFDPNDRARLTGRQLRNRAVVDTFEPGSTIKPVVVALSIDEGKVRPQSVIDTAPGWYRIGPAVVHDTSNHGVMTVSEAVQKSNGIIALAKLALNLPAEKIWTKYQQYGLGLRPELTFPGVASGKVVRTNAGCRSNRRPWRMACRLSASLLQILAGLYRVCRRRHDATRESATRCSGRRRAAAVRRSQPRGDETGNRAGDPHDAGNGDRRRRDGTRGGGDGLPDRRQDRYGAQTGRRGLREEPLSRAVRRHGADERPSADRRGDDRRSGRQGVLRRHGGRAGVQRSNGRRAAIAGSTAGCAGRLKPVGSTCRAVECAAHPSLHFRSINNY